MSVLLIRKSFHGNTVISRKKCFGILVISLPLQHPNPKMVRFDSWNFKDTWNIMLLQVINLAVSTVKLDQKLILKSKLLGRDRLISHVFHIDKFLMKNYSSEHSKFYVRYVIIFSLSKVSTKMLCRNIERLHGKLRNFSRKTTF